jgi:hypothetical protein
MWVDISLIGFHSCLSAVAAKPSVLVIRLVFMNLTLHTGRLFGATSPSAGGVGLCTRCAFNRRPGRSSSVNQFVNVSITHACKIRTQNIY